MPRDHDHPLRLELDPPGLFLPARISIHLTVHLDGPAGTATTGWEVVEFESQGLMCLGVDAPTGLGSELRNSKSRLTELYRLARGVLSPF